MYISFARKIDTLDTYLITYCSCSANLSSIWGGGGGGEEGGGVDWIR